MYFIRKAAAADAEYLPMVERSASSIFSSVLGLDWLAGDDAMTAERHRELTIAGAEWVASDANGGLLGFLAAEVDRDTLHIWEIAVASQHQGQGIGRALIHAAEDWATTKSLSALTLTTFRELPWNEPFYQSCGFETLVAPQGSSGLRAILDAEVAKGLPAERRCAMRRELENALSTSGDDQTLATSSQFTIRWAQTTDYQTLAAVLFAAVRDGPSAYTEAERAQWAPEPMSGPEWDDRLGSQQIILAEHDKAVVGFMSLTTDGYIDLAFLIPAARGRGLFTCMFAELKRYSKARGDERMWTHASRMARRAFEAVGFETRKREFATLGRERLERFEMERICST